MARDEGGSSQGNISIEFVEQVGTRVNDNERKIM